MSGEGQQQLSNLSGAGFSSDDLANWESQKRQDLSNAGFNDNEVNDYFGKPAFTGDKKLQDHFEATISAAADEAKGDGTAPAKPFTMEDAFSAGWQQSVSGLMKRGKAPDVNMPADTTWYQRLAYNTTGLAGDFPAMVGGFLLGGGAGAGAGAAAGSETGPGAVATGGAGAVVGGTAGAFAMPTLLRETMMDSYKNGEFKTPGEFLQRAGGIFLDTTKSYVTGALTAVAGGAAGTSLKAAGAGTVTRAAGTAAAEVGTMVTASKAMEGQLPKAQDFLDAAAMIAAFKTVPYVAGKIGDVGEAISDRAPAVAQALRDTYAKMGKMPEDVAQDAMHDGTIHQDIMAGGVPKAYSGLADEQPAPEAPKPAEPVAPEVGSPEEAKANILNKIQVGGTDKGEPKTWDNFYTKVIDDMNPLKLAVDKMTDGEKLPTAEDPYALARLTRGAFGKADQFLTQSPYKFDTYENVGKSFKDIVEPFKSNLDDLRAFTVAKRAQELEARGIKSGFNLDDANKVVDSFAGADRVKMEAAAKELGEYQNHLTQYLKDSGVLSQEAKDAMDEANKSYVPFYRVFDDEGITSGVSAGKGIGTKNPLKAIKGSDRAVIDPLESIIKNTYTYLALADRNEVAQKYIELANGTPEPSQFAEKVKTPIKGVTVQDAEMTKFLQDQGIEDVPEDLLTVFRAARQPLEPDQIAVFTDGKREVYTLPGDVASVFKAADRETANWLFRIITAPTKMFRAGVTLSPDFFPRNIIRDQYDALINSRNGFVPLLDTVRGAASMIKEDDSYQDWLKSGGANATMVTLDRDYIQNNVIKLNDETGFADHTWNLIKSPFDALRIVSELAENATRLGEFKKAMQNNLEAGADAKSAIQDAGFQSREVTLDFARIGSKMQATNMLIAFWNAQVQGIDRLGRRIQEDPIGTAAKIGASITIPSVLLWLNNHDDPRYKDIPDWQKDMYWIIMTKDHVYRIPKPHEAGILFGSGIERFLDYTLGKNPEGAKNYMADVAQSFAPGYVPTVAQPFIEQFANKSLFTGGNIIPTTTEKLLPQVQYQPYTTELAKALGGIVGTIPAFNKPGSIASPSVIENYIRQWTGGLGMYSLQLADAGLRKAGVLPDPVMPAATLADMPFIKAFVVRYPSANAQGIQNFYSEYDSHQQVLDTVQYLAKQGDFQSAVKLAQMNPQAMVKLGGIKQGLSNAQKFVQMVTKNPSMSATDKRQLIDSTYYQMINMAESGNELMRQIDQTMAK